MSQPKTKSKEKPSVDASVGKPVATVSRETLEDTPGRALSLLRAIGTSKLIRAAMADVGYETKDHQEGWELLHGVSGFAEDKPVEAVDSSVRDAILALDRWDEDGFRTVRATLMRRFPEQAAFVLDGIGPAEGPAAVLGVKALLVRLDALENGPDRKATRKTDHEALARLAKAGIDSKQRARLADLVAQSESVSDAPDPNQATAREEREAAYLTALIALRGWYEEWSQMARVAVKRRDYLIRMGLATRKTPEKKGEEDEEEKTPS